MKTITGKTRAWLASYGSPEDLLGSPDEVVNRVYFAQHDMTTSGWTLVGNATISFECADNDTLIQNKVAALRGELQTVRADAEIKANALEQKIQKLLAIEYIPEAA